MALCTANDFESDTGEVFLRPRDRCFMCGETLVGDVWAYWQGADEAGTQILVAPGLFKASGRCAQQGLAAIRHRTP